MELFNLSRPVVEEFYDVYKGVLPEYLPLIEHLSSSPVRKLLLPSDAPLALLRPFGGSTAFNVLDYFLGTPDIITKVC